MTILIITYDISPYRGSEASVSWNYVYHMMSTNKLVVLYGKGKKEIESYLQNNILENVEFINIPVKEAKGSGVIMDIRYNLNYREWHYQTYLEAKKIIDKYKIDIIHYLNPIGFKEPGYCWRIKDIPYVWGPVQGVENRPFCLYKALGINGIVDAIVRLIFHNGIMLFSPKIRKAVKRADIIFSATPNTVRQMKRIFGKETIYLPENGILKMNRNEPIKYERGSCLQIVWCGAIVYRKGLILLLDALRLLKTKNWHLSVIGTGSLSDYLQNVASDYGIANNISWYGSVPRTEVFKLMGNSHLHVISSLGDATTTVLFEAMSFAVPTMTLDHCGMAGVVCNKCGIKIPIHSYTQVVKDMAKNIENIIEHPEIINNLSSGVLECSKKYIWANRIKIFDDVYSKLHQEYLDKAKTV